MADISPEVFPQRHDAPMTRDMVAIAAAGPERFRSGAGARFERPAHLLACEVAPPAVTLTYATRPFLNITAQTHETRMPQFTEAHDASTPLTVTVTFWSPHILRVRFGPHHDAADVDSQPDAPGRMLIGAPDPTVTLTTRETADAFIVATSAITVHIAKDHYGLWAEDAQGQRLWETQQPDLFTADIIPAATATLADERGCFEAFALTPHEAIYGLGERFDAVQRRGRPVDFWNKDAIGTSSPRTYINVPFLWSTRGYGLFVNATARMLWDVGVSDAGTLGFAVADAQLDYFVIIGPDPAAILARYSTLTGFAPTPPVWSFGLWMSRNSYLSWEVVHAVADELRRRAIPCDVLHLDTAWFAEDWNCDLRFSPQRFPDPAAHFAALQQQGFRVSLWQYNFIPPREDNPNYVAARARGYLVQQADGAPFAYPEGTRGSWVDDAIIDFTNPDAAAWYADQIRDLIRLGAATIKTDFGEGIPEEGVFANGDGLHLHNRYSLLYNAVVAEAVHDVRGEHIVWARSGTAGSQRYPIHWGGDSQCSWNGLAGTVRGGLSLGLSGFPYFSHDIGGFIGRPDPELYIRWAQVGLLSSHARCHGAGDDNSREPWSFGEEANRIFQRYAELRYRLLPYIYTQALASASTAKPLMRALVMDYATDRNVWPIEDQYLFGDTLLVAPILQPLAITTKRAIYLPAGVWFDYWTKVPYASRGEWIERDIDLGNIPLYVKGGSVLPYSALRQSTDNQIGPLRELEIYGALTAPWHYAVADERVQVTPTPTGVQIVGVPLPTVQIFEE